MKISIDMDGVLARFDSAFAEACNRVWPGRLPTDFEPTNWDYTKCTDLSKAEVNVVWGRIKQTENFWLKLWPYSEGVIALARFLVSQKGHDVYFTTARVPTPGLTVAKQTQLWLDSCGIRECNNYVGVLVCEAERKWELYEAMDIAFSIDDKGTTVEECDLLLAPWHRAYLLDRPWNQEAKPARRIASVEEFLDAASHG